MSLLLALLFAPDVDRLAAPDYRTRETAESKLSAVFPLSEPALIGAATSSNPEVKFRASRALNHGAVYGFEVPVSTIVNLALRRDSYKTMGWLVGVDPPMIDWRLVDFALAKPDYRPTALWLIYAEFPTGCPLPFSPERVRQKYGRDRGYATAVGEFADQIWADPRPLECDPRTWADDMWPQKYGAAMEGLDHLRFGVRRMRLDSIVFIDATRWEAEAAWAAVRPKNRTYFNPKPPPGPAPEIEPIKSRYPGAMP